MITLPPARQRTWGSRSRAAVATPSFGSSPARDVEGFAEHDWAALARPGSVAAIYMGKRAAAFLRGRLLMRGAAPSTPVTIVENASRLDKRIVATTLLGLPEALNNTHFAGPVVLMLGMSASRRHAKAGSRLRGSAGRQV